MGTPGAHVRYEGKGNREVAIYESLVRIQFGFTQVLEALESLQKHKSYRGPTMNSAVRFVREARAGTLFEVLEILHAREEREWTRWGRKPERGPAR